MEEEKKKEEEKKQDNPNLKNKKELYQKFMYERKNAEDIEGIKETEKVWICEFCQNVNIVNIE